MTTVIQSFYLKVFWVLKTHLVTSDPPELIFDIFFFAIFFFFWSAYYSLLYYNGICVDHNNV